MKDTYEVTPKKGEWWYVKLKDAKTLAKKKITDITSLTVELDQDNTSFSSTSRYERSDIKFVEIINP